MEFAIEKMEEIRCLGKSKIKVNDAVIVVTGEKNKPYFSIRYTQTDNGLTYQGFGSYFINYVFDWFNEEIEIVNDVEQANGKANDWICDDCKKPESQVGNLVSGRLSIGHDGKEWIGIYAKGTASQIKDIMINKLGCEIAIMLDGGHIAAINSDILKKNTNQVQNNMIQFIRG